jgi:hypothetical protein
VESDHPALLTGQRFSRRSPASIVVGRAPPKKLGGTRRLAMPAGVEPASGELTAHCSSTRATAPSARPMASRFQVQIGCQRTRPRNGSIGSSSANRTHISRFRAERTPTVLCRNTNPPRPNPHNLLVRNQPPSCDPHKAPPQCGAIATFILGAAKVECVGEGRSRPHHKEKASTASE